MAYVTTTILLIQMYYGIYLKVDDEEYGKWDLMTEAVPPATALFFTLWIAFFTILHGDKVVA